MYNCRTHPERSRTKKNGGERKREILSSPEEENREECSSGASGFCKKKGGYNKINGKRCLSHLPIGDSQSH